MEKDYTAELYLCDLGDFEHKYRVQGSIVVNFTYIHLEDETGNTSDLDNVYIYDYDLFNEEGFPKKITQELREELTDRASDWISENFDD